MSIHHHVNVRWVRELSRQHVLPLHSPHQIAHWGRVYRNGMLIAQSDPAINATVVALFAFVHDSGRVSEFADSMHGFRAVGILPEYSAHANVTPVKLTEDDWKKLEIACVFHSDGDTTDDPTIGACWDADRLDLPRVGIACHPSYLSTPFARRPDIIESSRARALRWLYRTTQGRR